MKTTLKLPMFIVFLVALALSASVAEAAIATSLDLGSRGSEVTELQTYLATNPSLYPSGLVTGYFGPLTQEAVRRFQVAQGIVTSGTPATTGYGRVGPQTRARLNALMGVGPVQTSWDTVPVLSSPNVNTNNTSATVSWNTNEPTRGQVYYDTAPITTNEASGPRQQPPVSGLSVIDNGNLKTSHSFNLTNLRPNTIYYYLVRAVDSVGNMSMTWPLRTFKTD